MFLIEIVGKMPCLIGPYERAEVRKQAYFEFVDAGREVYLLDTFASGVACVGRHFREDR